MRMIKAVIFDWDGTLVDNMPVQYRAYREALKGFVRIKAMDLYIIEGKRSVDIISHLAKGLEKHEIEEVAARKDEIYRKISRGMKIDPSGKKLISKLKQRGLKIGLVTGTKRKNVNLILSKHDARTFDYILTADETKKPKPNPEPYLNCLRALEVKPGQALAVENAPLGIQSAKRAGLTCIAITSTLPKGRLKGADFIVKDLKEVEEIIFRKIGFIKK